MTSHFQRAVTALHPRRAALLWSGLFVKSYYLGRYPDVAAAGIDPALHYVRDGAAEGRTPHPLFDPGYYARAAGIRHLPPRQWLSHFRSTGEALGINPHPLVDLRRLAAGYGAARPFPGLLRRFARDPRPPCNPHPLFDVRFYLESYADVAESNINPLVHYVSHGMAEGRLPSPLFDAYHYASQLSRAIPAGMPPLQHYVEIGGPLGLSPSPGFDPHAFAKYHAEGRYRGVDLLAACLDMHGGTVPEQYALLPASSFAPTPGLRAAYRGRSEPGGERRVLIVAHVSAQFSFGAERSFLDMVAGAAAAGYAVFAVLPRIDLRYIASLLPHCAEVAVLSYGWWRDAKPVEQGPISAFRQYIVDRRIDLVHANTIMLREPLLAARSEKRPALVHVREIIKHDPDLLALIGEPAEAITKRVASMADVVIGNSVAAGRAYPGDRVRILPNCIDAGRFALPPRPADGTVRFGLLSSNIAKKGLVDFVLFAKACRARIPKARFVAIGPSTDYSRSLQAELSAEGLADAVEFPGYFDDPAAAIATIDVVVNFSHFAESFGRTVLEGFAAGRPAIVYDHGALPELVKDGINGFVVPYRSWEAAVPLAERLCSDEALRKRLGAEGTLTATRFSAKQYSESLGAIYREILDASPSAGDQPPGTVPDTAPPPARVLAARRLPHQIEQADLRVAYFVWHFPVPSETFVLNELRHLVSQGVDVKVFCRHSPHPDFKLDFPITWERISSPEELAARLQATGRNMVHAHFVYPTVTDMAWPACQAAGIPFTFIAHAQDIFRHDNDARNRIGEIGRSALCMGVIALGRFHRDYLIERGVPDEKLLILHQGIDLALHPLRAPKAPGRVRKIVAIQRFVEKKGIDRLIRAASLLAGDTVRIELYGYGPEEEALKKLAAELDARNVEFMGPIAGREPLVRVLADADLLVAPCIRTASGDMDGIPTVLIEAMAVGVPVLATPVASIPDLVVGGITGFLAQDSEPATLAKRIREALSAPAEQTSSMVQAARHRVEQRFNSHRQVAALLSFWTGRTLDIVIVSWNNLPQLREVIARVFRFTRMPFHLIVCDNASNMEVREFLYGLQRERDNVTVIDRGFNSYVGPGTNCAIDHGRSDYIVYLCAKEAFVVQHGWELAIVNYMDTEPDVGLAGTLGYSPAYLKGSDYPKGIATFKKFRNTEFASLNPDRVFRHVQGGLFAIRRAMYQEIGGFSDAVPHNHTDVEYSFYVESRGWRLGAIPAILALYQKTRPPLAARLTEDVLAVHPPTLEDLPGLDALAAGARSLCNICFSYSDAYTTDRRCAKCGSEPAARTLMRALAESTLTYRRLKGLFIAPPAGIESFVVQQFPGLHMPKESFLRLVAGAAPAGFRPDEFDVAYVGHCPEAGDMPSRLADEIVRALAPGAILYIAGNPRAFLGDRRLELHGELLYASGALQYDWNPLHVFTLPPAQAPGGETAGARAFALGTRNHALA
jgi:glycosyltransferase involved in cell wall biosynthesis